LMKPSIQSKIDKKLKQKAPIDRPSSPMSSKSPSPASREELDHLETVIDFSAMININQDHDIDDLGQRSGFVDHDDPIEFDGLVDNDVLRDRLAVKKKKSLFKLPKIFEKLRSKRSQLAKDELREIAKKDISEFGTKNTPDRIRRLLKQAHMGYADAQFSLGYCYDLGTSGVGPDTEEAIQWYSAAGYQGHAIAQNNLGVLYTTGHRNRVEKQPAEALHWFKLGASNGNRNAAFHAGLAYLNGDVDGRDDEGAFKFFKIAAKQNHVLAMSNVGAMYMSGRGILRNYKKAVKWMKKAVRGGNDAVACHNLGVCYENGYVEGGVDMKKANEYFGMSRDGSNRGIISEKLSEHTRKNGLTLYNS